MGSVIFRASLFVFLTIAFGCIFSHFGLNFIFGLAFGASFQFIFSYAISQFVNAYINLQNKKLENERIKEFSYQGVVVECPCHEKIRDIIPFRFNTENKYKCRECNKTVSVFADAYTAIATEPILDTDTTKPDILTNAIKQQY